MSADTISPPELSFASLSPSAKYLVVCLDLDAPYPSWDKLGPILHWNQPDLQPEPSSSGGFTLKITGPPIANYAKPQPPPYSAPHRYTFFLYEQPADFDVSKFAPPSGQDMGNWPRVLYSLDTWEKETMLGPVVAANYYTCN